MSLYEEFVHGAGLDYVEGLFAVEREIRALLDHRLEPLGITYAQFVVLRFIIKPKGKVARQSDPVIRVTDVAEFYGFALRTVTVCVGELIRRGWVMQKKIPTDRRAKALVLTREGEQLFLKATRIHDHSVSFFRSLPMTHMGALQYAIFTVLVSVRRRMRHDRMRSRYYPA